MSSGPGGGPEADQDRGPATEGTPVDAGARDAALSALVRVDAGAPAGVALHEALRRLRDPRERALATELVYGVSRVRGALDAVLGPVCRRPLHRLEPAVRAALRLGAYQLRHLDRVPAHAAVGTSVDLVRRHGSPGAAGLVNAVLRRLAAEAPSGPVPAVPGGEASQDAPPTALELAARYAHPAWLVQRWMARLGPEAAARLLAANNARPPLCLRANVLRTDGAALRAELAAAGLEVEPGRFLPEAVRLRRAGDPGRLPAVAEGRCTVQGEASMLVAHVADPSPGDLCLDVAAAPGGKSTHLAEWMGDRGTVVANDVRPERAALCAQAALRLGLSSVETRSGDARRLPEEFGRRCAVVVADLPCTGLGTLATRPDLRWRRGPDDIGALAELQGEVLDAAGRCVRPGGVLVYSTCTTEPEENEAVVAGFLAAHPEFAPLDLGGRLPPALADDPAARAGMLRLWPHIHGTDGFFIAGLRRRDRG